MGLRRLFMSKINRPPISIARLIRKMKGEDRADKIAVVVGTVTNDLRIFKIPKLKVSPVQFTLWSFPFRWDNYMLKCFVELSVIKASFHIVGDRQLFLTL